VTAPHVAHTWPLGWTVGSVGGDALSAIGKNPRKGILIATALLMKAGCIGVALKFASHSWEHGESFVSNLYLCEFWDAAQLRPD